MSARRRPRVLYCTDLSTPGGSHRHRDAVIRGLHAHGWDVEHVDGIQSTIRTARTRSATYDRPRRPQRTVATLALLANTLAATVSLVVRTVVFRPHVILWRPGPFGLHGALAAALLHRPLVLEVNAPLAVEADGRFAFVRLAARIERWVAGQAVATIAVSAAAARLAGSRRVHVVPNGGGYADPQEAELARRWGATTCPVCSGHARGPFAVLLESFRPWHDDRQRRVAIASLPRHWKVLVCGDGPQRGEFLAWASSAGLGDRLVCLGDLPGPATQHVLAAHADLGFALYAPRDNFYFSPLKLYDFVAHGIPVVSTADVQDARLSHLADHGGLLAVPARDPASLPAAVHAATKPHRGLAGAKHAEAGEPRGRRHADPCTSPFGWMSTTARYAAVLESAAATGNLRAWRLAG